MLESNPLPHCIWEAYDFHAMSDVTRFLDAMERGEPRAAEELLPLVYEELRHLAVAKMANEQPGQTLQPTALVHEAWLRLLGPDGANQSWNSRGHFFGAAAQAMRRILVDNARRKATPKRGGDWDRVGFDQADAITTPLAPEELMALDEALDELRNLYPRGAELVNLRFFAGLTQEQAAHALGISTATAERTWAFCRLWLFKKVREPHSAVS